MAPSDHHPHRRLSRRDVLRLAGAAGAVGAVAFIGSMGPPVRRTTRTGRTGSWSDPATWGGAVPGTSDAVVIRGEVILDEPARVAGVEVEPGGALVFDPARSQTLESTGNVVVRGRLAMRPERPRVQHRLIFTGVDEASFEGGGAVVIDRDVGLWVVDDGVLRLLGSQKRAWIRAEGAIAAGTTVIDLARKPTGWRVGDEVAITPTISPSTEGHETAYDEASIVSIDGRRIRLSRATTFAHPEVEVAKGRLRTAEVLNLSRNVHVEGTESGRSHVFLKSSRPQVLRNAELRHLGPRRGSAEATELIAGRYPVHFHECGGGSRGSIVRGVVVRDCGSHAFVPHASHGVTFRDCVSHDTFEDAYWWDVGHETHDTTWDRCVASLVRSDPPFRGFLLTGFYLGAGRGNVTRRCVAVGVQGTATASGYHWPEPPEAQGTWTFKDCLAHNNAVNGVYVWQNTPSTHDVFRFVAYHNGASGIHHGAYLNHYLYDDMVLYGNRAAALTLAALSNEPGLRFIDVVFDAAGLSDYAVRTAEHVAPPSLATRFLRCEFRGYRSAGVAFLDVGQREAPDRVDVEDCVFSGNEFWLDDGIHADSLIRVQDPAHGSIELRRADQPGDFVSRWNASVREIAAF